MESKYSLPKDGGLIADEAFKDLTQRYERIATQAYESEYEGVQYIADNIVAAIKGEFICYCIVRVSCPLEFLYDTFNLFERGQFETIASNRE